MGRWQAVQRTFWGKLLTSKWGKAFLGLFLLLALGTIGINIYLKTLVNMRLTALVRDSSNGLYTFNYTNININVLTGNLTIHQAELIPDTAVFARLKQHYKAPRFLVEGKTQKLSFKNVRWLTFLNNQKLKIGRILIHKPQFKLKQYRLQKDSTHRSSNIYQLISKHVRDLHIGSFGISDAMIDYQVADTTAGIRKINRIEHLNLGFTNVHFDGKTGEDRRLAADRYYIRLKDYKHRTADSMYWIGIKRLDYNSANKRAILDSFYVEPFYSEKDFRKKLTHQETYYKIGLENIVAEGFDMSSFVEEGEAIIKKIRIGKGTMDMYMDRSLPVSPVDRRNVVLSQKITNLDFPFTIRSMNFKDIDLNYREFIPLSGQTALIAFRDISGNASNITSLPSFIMENAQMKLELTARFLNAGVEASFEFDLASNEGNFISKVRTHQIDADKLNPILAPIAKIEARKGVVRQLEATIRGNESHAIADVNLLYEGLKINVLKIEGDMLARKGFKTMLANLFIEDDNPKDGILRTASRVLRERRHGKSFFNMLWSSVSAGMQQIIMKKKGMKI